MSGASTYQQLSQTHSLLYIKTCVKQRRYYWICSNCYQKVMLVAMSVHIAMVPDPKRVPSSGGGRAVGRLARTSRR